MWVQKPWGDLEELGQNKEYLSSWAWAVIDGIIGSIFCSMIVIKNVNKVDEWVGVGVKV